MSTLSYEEMEEMSNLYNSLKEDLEKRIERETQKIDNYKEKEKAGTLSLLEQMQGKMLLKGFQRQRESLSAIMSSMFDLYFADNTIKELPSSLKEKILELAKFLKKEEAKNLADFANNAVSLANHDIRKKVNEYAAQAEKEINKNKLEHKEVIIKSRVGEYRDNKTYGSILNTIKNGKRKGLFAEQITILNFGEEFPLATGEDLLLKNLEEMIRANKLSSTDNNRRIIGSFEDIKNAFQSKAQADAVIIFISSVQNELRSTEGFDLSDVKTYLKSLEEIYKKQLSKANGYLSKFNFAAVEEEIKSIKAKDSEKDREDFQKNRYSRLAYELEQVMATDPHNEERINAIKDQMRDFELHSGLTDLSLNALYSKGQKEYRDETENMRLAVEAKQEMLAAESQAKKDVMMSLREYAIREIELNGGIEESFEFRNGDAYSKPDNREAIISSKVQELMKLADMTPEQRGLYELKKAGKVSQLTTLNDLPAQQLMDFRYAYRDESYPFMAGLKALKKTEDAPAITQTEEKEENLTQGQTIYKEYLKYRAANRDNRISFRDYAQQKYHLDNMDIAMIEEEMSSTQGTGRR